MAEPAESDLNLFDLYEQPRDVAAAKARARALALQRERAIGLADMYTPVPEFQKAGEAQFARAEKERSAVNQQMPESVLKLALEKTSQERQLAALQQQIAYQNAQLGLMNRQFQESVRKTQSEEDRQDYEAYKRGLATPPAGMVEREGKTAGELANIEAVTKAVGNLPLVPKAAAEAIGGVLKAGKSAELKGIEEEKTKAGYRQEAPLSFEEFVKAKRSGFTHPAMGGGVSPAVPMAPGGAPSMATQGPIAHTHYRYSADGLKRMPTDASGKQVGPVETSKTPWPR